MLKSPNDVLIESKDGRGNINMKGTVNIDTANIRNLSSNTVNDLKQQIQDIRRAVNQLNNTTSNTNVNNSPTNLQSVVQQVIRQQTATITGTSNQDLSLINARLNTVQDQINALETRMNNVLVSIDERFVALQNSTFTVDSQNSSESQSQTQSQTSNGNNVVILRKTPVTNKNVRYAW
jgi:chaperonin cofactor prefoldin